MSELETNIVAVERLSEYLYSTVEVSASVFTLAFLSIAHSFYEKLSCRKTQTSDIWVFGSLVNNFYTKKSKKF